MNYAVGTIVCACGCLPEKHTEKHPARWCLVPGCKCDHYRESVVTDQLSRRDARRVGLVGDAPGEEPLD